MMTADPNPPLDWDDDDDEHEQRHPWWVEGCDECGPTPGEWKLLGYLTEPQDQQQR